MYGKDIKIGESVVFFLNFSYRKYLDGYGVVAGPKPKAGPWMACGGVQPK
jgi:hypothetical protein